MGEDAGFSRRSARRHFELFDGLRALAALIVVVCHAGLALGINGQGLAGRAAERMNLGVAIFFAISGFLLYRPFVAARAGDMSAPDLGRYALRRFVRIVPAYWLALTVLAVWPGLDGVLSGGAWVYYGFAQIYDEGWAQQGLFPAWSLCIEITFYAFLPLYAWAIARWAPRHGGLRAELTGLAGLVLLAWAMRWALVQTDYAAPGFFLSLFGRMDWFVPGMALAVASVHLQDASVRPRAVAWIEGHSGLAWAGAGALFVLLCSPVVGRLGAGGIGPGGALVETAVYAAISLLVIAPAVFVNANPARPGLPRRLLGLRPVLWIGLVSYGVYLWHYPLAFEVAPLFDGMRAAVALPVTAAVLAGVTLCFAAASWYGLERPLQRAARRREQEQVAPLDVAEPPAALARTLRAP